VFGLVFLVGCIIEHIRSYKRDTTGIQFGEIEKWVKK
jgi:hypothetical protein